MTHYVEWKLLQYRLRLVTVNVASVSRGEYLSNSFAHFSFFLRSSRSLLRYAEFELIEFDRF